ncbi:SpoIIE family protein phosphatase [bacterium]|nr:SpoIIE family protein phosphatase [bacterium]
MGSSLYVEVPHEPPFEVRLDKDAVSVGRAEDNVLGLRDMNVSRHHFAIERRDKGWLLRDKGSRNGTLVNRSKVFEQLLRDGDRIEVGGSALTFRAQSSRLAISTDTAPRPRPSGAPRETVQPAPSPAPGTVRGEIVAGRPTPPPVQHTPSALPRAIATPADPQEAVRARGDRTPPPHVALTRPLAGAGPALAPDAPPSTRSEQRRTDRWRKLAELTGAINQERDLSRLLERIVDAILSLVPAKGAFLVLLQEGKLEVKVARNLERAKIDDPNGAYRLSWQICKDAIAQKRPVLTHDATADEALAEFASVVNMKLRSLLCVPFGHAGEVIGVVYMDEPVLGWRPTGASAALGVAPPEEVQDVIDLVAAFGDLAGIAFSNAQHLEEVKQRERMAETLKFASRIQRKLLPEVAPVIDGLEVAGRTIPAEEVGGDLYDFVCEPGGDLYISIGDVSGKGVGAGIVMASVRALLRAYAERETRTDRILVAINRALVRDLERGSFVSFLLLRWSRVMKMLTFAGAGHEHLIILRQRTGEPEALRAGGVVLGLSPDLEGRVEEKPLGLEPGDLVVLYTDGATEAASPTGEEYGLERLMQAVKEAKGLRPAQVVDHVIQRVDEHAGHGSVRRSDDLTVVAIRRV